MTTSQNEGGQTKLLKARAPGAQAPRDDEARFGLRDVRRSRDRRVELLAGARSLFCRTRRETRRRLGALRALRLREPGAGLGVARALGDPPDRRATGALVWTPDPTHPRSGLHRRRGATTARGACRADQSHVDGSVRARAPSRQAGPCSLARRELRRARGPGSGRRASGVASCLVVPVAGEGAAVGFLFSSSRAARRRTPSTTLAPILRQAVGRLDRASQDGAPHRRACGRRSNG